MRNTWGHVSEQLCPLSCDGRCVLHAYSVLIDIGDLAAKKKTLAGEYMSGVASETGRLSCISLGLSMYGVRRTLWLFDQQH